jgi:hypothetical protein
MQRIRQSSAADNAIDALCQMPADVDPDALHDWGSGRLGPVGVKSRVLTSRAMSPSAGCGHWAARASRVLNGGSLPG